MRRFKGIKKISIIQKINQNNGNKMEDNWRGKINKRGVIRKR